MEQIPPSDDAATANPHRFEAGIEADYESMARLCEEHGLNFPVEE